MSGDLPMDDQQPDDAHRILEARLVVECERFLEGRYAEHLAVAGGDVPAWAWLNLVAHATEDRLHAISCLHLDNGAPGWGRALARLADDVNASIPGAGSLRRLQLSVLIPLELYLAARPEMDALGPDELVARVRAALHHHPSAQSS